MSVRSLTRNEEQLLKVENELIDDMNDMPCCETKMKVRDILLENGKNAQIHILITTAEEEFLGGH